MILSITGDVQFRLTDLKPDTSVEGSKMNGTELIVGEVSTRCIIRTVLYGDIEKLNSEPSSHASIIVFGRTRHTAHTRKGFVEVQITTKPVQFCAYIHVAHLERFLGVCAMSTVRKGLGL